LPKRRGGIEKVRGDAVSSSSIGRKKGRKKTLAMRASRELNTKLCEEKTIPQSDGLSELKRRPREKRKRNSPRKKKKNLSMPVLTYTSALKEEENPAKSEGRGLKKKDSVPEEKIKLAQRHSYHSLQKGHPKRRRAKNLHAVRHSTGKKKASCCVEGGYASGAGLHLLRKKRKNTGTNERGDIRKY